MATLYTPYEDTVTAYRATDMNAPLEQLDTALVAVDADLTTAEGEIDDLQTEITAARGVEAYLDTRYSFRTFQL